MSRPFTFQVEESAGRRPLHLEEVYKHGLSELKIDRPPIIFPIGVWATITDDEAPVQYERTSGEVEIVTIDDGTGELYVTVGSDSTDRELETSNLAGARNIRWSKQVAPNVVAPSSTSAPASTSSGRLPSCAPRSTAASSRSRARRSCSPAPSCRWRRSCASGGRSR